MLLPQGLAYIYSITDINLLNDVFNYEYGTMFTLDTDASHVEEWWVDAFPVTISPPTVNPGQFLFAVTEVNIGFKHIHQLDGSVTTQITSTEVRRVCLTHAHHFS